MKDLVKGKSFAALEFGSNNDTGRFIVFLVVTRLDGRLELLNMNVLWVGSFNSGRLTKEVEQGKSAFEAVSGLHDDTG